MRLMSLLGDNQLLSSIFFRIWTWYERTTLEKNEENIGKLFMQTHTDSKESRWLCILSLSHATTIHSDNAKWWYKWTTSIIEKDKQ